MLVSSFRWGGWNTCALKGMAIFVLCAFLQASDKTQGALSPCPDDQSDSVTACSPSKVNKMNKKNLQKAKLLVAKN